MTQHIRITTVFSCIIRMYDIASNHSSVAAIEDPMTTKLKNSVILITASINLFIFITSHIYTYLVAN